MNSSPERVPSCGSFGDTLSSPLAPKRAMRHGGIEEEEKSTEGGSAGRLSRDRGINSGSFVEKKAGALESELKDTLRHSFASQAFFRESKVPTPVAELSYAQEEDESAGGR